jgi:hypothetical protein
VGRVDQEGIMAVRRDDETAAGWHVSTGRLPPSERVRSLVIEAYE